MRPKCEGCRIVYEDNPPCKTCYPVPHAYNEGILELYQEVDGQYITGPSGVVDLNLLAVAWVMDRLGVDEADQLWASRKVRYFSNLVVSAIREKAEEK